MRQKAQDLRDRQGALVNQTWLAQMAVHLLEKAQEGEEPDHQACTKYLDLLARILLPKVAGNQSPEISQASKEALERALLDDANLDR